MAEKAVVQHRAVRQEIATAPPAVSGPGSSAATSFSNKPEAFAITEFKKLQKQFKDLKDEFSSLEEKFTKAEKSLEKTSNFMLTVTTVIMLAFTIALVPLVRDYYNEKDRLDNEILKNQIELKERIIILEKFINLKSN